MTARRMRTGRFTRAHCHDRSARARRRVDPGLAGGREVVAGQLEETRDRRLLALQALGHAARMIGGHGQEVVQAALGVVGQRVDAGDVLLGADDPHRRAALGQRPGAADGRDDHPPLGRRLPLIVVSVIVGLAVSFVLARWLTTENRERDAIYALLVDQARGDAAGVIGRLDGCATEPACVATQRRNAQRLARRGEVKIVRLDSDTSYALGTADGVTRVVWTVLPGSGSTVVQCVEVHRGGTALAGRTVTLRRLSAPIGRESPC